MLQLTWVMPFKSFLCGLLPLFLVLVPSFASAKRNLIVITDMEPDDRIALEIIAARLSSRVQFIGSTVKNSYRKAALVRDQLSGTALASVPVLVGSGGEAGDYVDIASSRAAREYHQEGHGILDANVLAKLNQAEFLKGSEELKIGLRDSLAQATEENSPVEIILLAPPTDLIAVLESHPEYKKGIGHIHVMGGWVDVKNAQTGILEKRTTYNVNMDPKAGAKLMTMTDIPMTLYSSHIIKPNFAGGSVSSANFPEIIGQIENARAHGLAVFRLAGKSWDSHLMKVIPSLRNIIGKRAGRQFTPADPLVVVGILNPLLIKNSIPVDVKIDVHDMDQARGFKVEVNEDVTSKIRLITEIDTSVFAVETLRALRSIESSQIRRRDHFGANGSCARLLDSSK